MHRVLVFSVLCLSLCLGLLSGCATSPKSVPRAAQALKNTEKTGHIWLVSNGFHTSIAMRAEDAPAELRAFDPKARFFVIGWGGREFYMGRITRPWDYVLCTVLPTASTLHIIPVRTTLLKECSRSEIIEFDVSPKGLEHVSERISRAFQRDPFGQPEVAGPGRMPHSQFFSGKEIYMFPKTCNRWAASHLRSAGVPIVASTAIVADNILWQGRKYGRVLAQRRVHGDLL